MDIIHHTAITTPAVAAPSHPLGNQQKGLVENHKAIQNTLVDQVANTNKHQQTDPMFQSEDNLPLQGSDGQRPSRMVLLRYGHQTFPDGVLPRMAEVPAHLDIQRINVSGDYSLHAEYSSKPRKFNSPLLEGLDAIKESHRRDVPELWTSLKWAQEFAVLMTRLVGENPPPCQIEIHPPFFSASTTIDDFLARYEAFEETIHALYPGCGIVIENRAGTKHPNPFIMSDSDSILAMGKALQQSSLKLGIALDITQMFTANFGSKHLVGHEGVSLIERLWPIRERIHTIHLWGRGPGGGAHGGGLEGVFASTDARQACLNALRDLISDGDLRYLVLEVRKAADVAGIIQDLEEAGIALEAMA
ncbi:MAG: hypothetical protein LWW79_07625 [Holophagaceae bacterium]|nr:hypothetical protein [Holophagaceae bacterium]